MKPTQIYSVVNSLAKQALGTTALTVVDNQGLVSLGDEVLSSQSTTENFLNTLVDRIAKTIISIRSYTPLMVNMRRDDYEWGRAVQKISFKLGEMVEDDSVTLTNGQSVDMYEVNKPEVIQKMFITSQTFERFVTIQRKWLTQAFQSAGDMDRFISGIYTSIENEFSLAEERLQFDCIANMFGELDGVSSRTISLVTNYNNLTDESLTAETALQSEKFLTYMVTQIKHYSEFMERMSLSYNDGSVSRHTPKALQNLLMQTDASLALENTLLANTFHDFYLDLGLYKTVPYWQAEQSPMDININRASDGAAKNLTDIVACLYDYEAVGTFLSKREVYTTPMNARGKYYNTFWTAEKQFFNDLSENFIVFKLA